VARRVDVRELIPVLPADDAKTALTLAELILATQPDKMRAVLGSLLWHHPLATFEALRSTPGLSRVDPELVISSSHSFFKPAMSEEDLTIAGGLRAYLEVLIKRDSTASPVHDAYARFLLVNGQEDAFLECVCLHLHVAI
jgi:hypothetical protein